MKFLTEPYLSVWTINNKKPRVYQDPLFVIISLVLVASIVWAFVGAGIWWGLGLVAFYVTVIPLESVVIRRIVARQVASDARWNDEHPPVPTR
jgi:hypothetical protein